MTYRLAPAPKLAAQYEWDCMECGHETLTSPVFVECGNGPVAVGTGCAAKLLGLPVAELEADLAVAEMVAAASEAVASCWGFFLACLPGRVTPKFMATATGHAFGRTDIAELVATTYRAVVKAGRSPRDIKPADLR